MTMPDNDEPVDAIIAEYLEAERNGTAEPPDAVIARHPEVAAELRSFFADRDRFVRFAGSPAPGPALSETVGLAGPTAVGDRVAYFGDYELLEEIARGGMGVVYKARQVSLNRTVALKLILAGQLASEADVGRFRREAEAVANLDHPNIVPVYEVGEHQGQHYFTMKLVSGGSLQGQMAELRGDRRRAARLVATVARAVDHAHHRGVIHRDLKPGNILLDAAGEPMVVDFGLARKVEGAEAVTRTGAVVGTPAYMAPEQAAARKDVTTAVDVYGLGAVLYECLTGRAPFVADTPIDTLLQVMNREPDRPRATDPTVPIDLETIALKCLEKDPGQRYPTADALADDLERWLRGEPISARPVGVIGRTWRWCRRNPAVATLAGSTAVVLLAGTVVSTLLAVRAASSADAAHEARRNAEESAQTEFEARQQASRELDRAEQLLYANQIVLAQREWQSKNPDRARDLLQSVVPDRRGWEWHYLRRLAAPPGPVLTGHRDGIEEMAFSPDGQQIAAVGGFGHPGQPYFTRIWDARTGREVAVYDGKGGSAIAYRPDLNLIATPHREGVVLWDPTTGKDIRILEMKGDYEYRDKNGQTQTGSFSGGRAEHLAFSPDGKRVAAAGDARVLVWTVADGKLVFARPGGAGVSFSPDGQLVATGSDLMSADLGPMPDAPPTIWIYDATGKEQIALRGHTKHLRLVTFSPDGKQLAAADWTSTIKVWDATTKFDRVSIRLTDFDDMAFSPDGTQLAVAGRFDRRVSVWDTATGAELYSVPAHGRIVTAVAFAPDGRSLAAAGGEHRDPDRSVRFWPNGDPAVTTFRNHKDGVWTAVFLPDGKRVVSAGGTAFAQPGQVILWDATTGRELRAFQGHTSIVFCVAVSEDGKVLATGSADKTVRLWDVETGKELKTLTGHRSHVMGLCFSPDGRRLVTVGDRHGEKEFAPVEVRVWDVATGQSASAVTGVAGLGRAVAFRPDGEEFAVAATEVDIAAKRMTAVITLHAPDGHLRKTLRLDPNTRAVDVAYRPDSRRLGVALLAGTDPSAEGGGIVKDYDVVSSEWRDLIPTRPGGPMALAYHPKGRRLATGNADGTVKVWDAETGRELLTLSGSNHAVGHVTFSPDGSRLAAAGGDGLTVRVWDAE